MSRKMAKWKKITLWSIAGVVSLLVIVLVTAVLLVKYNNGFRQHILAKVAASVEDSTGARLEVRDFDLHLSTLSLDLYDITLHGTESSAQQPLLQAGHMNVAIKILSFFHAQWRLENLAIDHPVAHVYVDKRGENNLPKPKQQSSGNTSLFDLAIQRFVLDHGEVYYNDKKSPLDAELHDFNLSTRFDNSQSRYYGDLGYHQGRIQYGAYSPLVHDLQAHFDATPTHFNLDPMELATGGSHITLKAAMDDYSSPKVQASYQAILVADDFRRLLKDPSLPTGTVRLDGSLNYQSDPRRPALETVSLHGTLDSRELNVKTSSLGARVQDLAARYKVEGGNAEVQDLHAQLLGGRLDANLAVRDLTGAARGKLQASLKNVSLKDVAVASGNEASLDQASLNGKVNATAEASWAKTLDNLIAHADATLQGVLGKNSSSVPLNGVVHADYANATRQLALNNSYVKTPQTSVTLNGKISDRSQLEVRMQSNDLHELELLAANFTKPAPGQPPQELGLYGTAVFNGSVKGSTSAPQITGQFAANNLRVKGSSWRVLRSNISASPSLVSLSNGDLESATRGKINFDAQARLSHWAYQPSNPMVVKVSASQLSIADLERLAGQTYPVSGTLSVDVSLHGSQLSPVGNGNITVANAKVASESIQSLNLRFQGTGDAVEANLTLQMPAGTSRGNVTYYPKTESYKAQLQATGLRLEKVQALQPYQVNGGLNLNAGGQGTLHSPELNASLQVPTLQVKGQIIRGFTFNTTLRNRVAEIALNSEVAETYVKANGTVGMDAPYMTNLQVDTGRIPFQPLLAVYLPAQAANMGGQTELHMKLHGPLQDKSRLEAHLEIPVLAVNYKDVQLAAAKPIQVDYQNNVATLQPTAIEGTGTNIRMQGRVPVADLKAATFLAQGTIDLRLAEIIEPDIQSSGQIKFDINSQKYAASNLQGEIQLVNGNVQAMGAPLGLTNANGVINVTRERLQIKNFEGQVGGGTVTATGGVAYQPSVQFDLALRANDVRLRYPDGVRAMLGSNLSLTGSTQAAQLTGQIRIEQVSFTPDFNLADFIEQFSGESAPPPQQGFATNVKMNVAVQSTSQMNLTSSKVSLQGSANLRIAGTAADPVILGRANLTGGEIFMASNRYVIQSGTVDFLNPVETQPVVNLQVTTVVNEYNIGMHFEGPIARLQTSYTSDPPLPPVDIINLLAFGKTTEASAANPSPSGTAGAEGLLAQGIGSQVSSRIEKFVGVSQLSIDPTLGGDQTNPGARVAVQERVTGNLFVTFATDITSTQRQQIKIEYQLNPRWSLSGVRDQNGGLGVDAKYKKTF